MVGFSSRKGSIPWMFEALFSLILLAIFAYGIFTYISTHASGEAYFSDVYSIDLATSTDLVNAGSGDVVLRYDYIKPDLDLGFLFSAGNILVGKPAMGGPPVLGARRYYGIAKKYPFASTAFIHSKYLVLRKIGPNFAVTEDMTTLSSCNTVETPVVSAQSAKVFIDVKGGSQSDSQKVRQAFSDTLKTISLVDESLANVKIYITTKTGDANTLDIDSTSPDGGAFACAFKAQLPASTLIPYITNGPSSATSTTSTTSNSMTVRMTITTSNKNNLTPDKLGRTIATAFAAYLR